jgi:integrase
VARRRDFDQAGQDGRPADPSAPAGRPGGTGSVFAHGRPATQAREIFIRHRAPFEPFVAANNLSAIMRTALGRVGLAQRPGRRGLYLFRHTLATRLLTAECPIKTIGDVLGHVSTDTTMEYANVDLQALRKVSL